VPRDAVILDQHLVSRLADQRVLEPVLGVPGEPAAVDELDHALLDQHREPRRGVGAPDQRLDPAAPERLAEDARRAQHPARRRIELLDPGLHHRQHAGGRAVALAGGPGADQLLEVRRVAVRVLDQLAQRVFLDAVAQALAHHLCAGPPRQAAQPDLLDTAVGPQLREQLVDLGAGEREHQQRLVEQRAERGVHQLDRRQIAPVQVLEHDHHRLDRALGAQHGQERLAHHLARQLGVLRRGVVSARVASVERRADQIAEHLDEPHAAGVGAARDPRPELVAPRLERFAVDQPHRAAQHLGEQAEHRAGVERVALADPDLERPAAGLEPAQELVAEPRLADALGAAQEHHARHPLLGALVEDHRELVELLLAAHAHDRLAERDPLEIGLAQLAAQLAPGLAGVEPVADQRPGELVDPHGARGGRGVAQLERAAHQVAVAQARADHLAAGDHDHRAVVEQLAHRQRAARRADREVGRRVGARQRDQQVAVGEQLELAAVALDQIVERALLGRALGDAQPGLGALGQPGHHQADQPPLGRHQLGHHAARPRAHRQRARVALLDREQLAGDRVAGGRPVLRRARQHARDQLVERLGDRRPELAQPRQLLRRAVEQHAQGVGAAERRAPRDAAVQHAAEREDVGPAVEVGHVVDLLGRDVARRAEHRAGHRELGIGERAARHPEVDQEDLVDRAIAEEQVARLDVAVHHAAAMDRAERRRHAPADRDRLGEGQLGPLQPLGQGLARQPLHHQVRLALRGDPAVDVADDPRVGQRREDLGLAGEALELEALRVVHHLQGDQRTGLPVARPIDLAHPPEPRQLLDREPLVDDLSAPRHPLHLSIYHSYIGARSRREPMFLMRADMSRKLKMGVGRTSQP
jgi:hypothetical protein